MPESRLAETSLSKLTIPELKTILDEKGIEYKNNVSKKEVLKLLEGTE